LWYHRLGHPASSVVQRVLNLHKLSFIKGSNKEGMCDACQQGKSHQLPYPQSISVSSGVLDLVFFDVWGPAPNSVSQNKYYVSFIDDYSKFTWVYLLRQKSEVFSVFHNFQSLVERQFDRKIRSIQTDWGGVSCLEHILHKHGDFTPCIMPSCTSAKRFRGTKTLPHS
jgi:histone deacetylase 1/2